MHAAEVTLFGRRANSARRQPTLTLQMGIADKPPTVRSGYHAPPRPRRTAALAANRRSDRQGKSARCTGGSQRAQTLSHADRREATHSGCQNGSDLSMTHLKMVGMAGFEPATSCSQISSAQSPGVAPCRLACRSPGVMLAGRRLTSPVGCARWLPLWLPPSRPGTRLLPVERNFEFRKRDHGTPVPSSRAGEDR